MNETRRRHRLLHWSDWPLIAKGLVVVAVPVAALLVSRVSILRSQAATESALRIVQVSRQQDREITSVRLAMLNAETGVRGYLLTADRSFLAPYKVGQQTLDQRLDQLERNIRLEGTEGEVRQVVLVRALAGNEMTILTDLIIRGQQLAPRDRDASLGASSDLGDRIATLLDDMDRRERAAEAQQRMTANIAQRQTRLLTTVGFPLGILGGLLALLLFVTSISRRVRQVSAHATRMARGEPTEAAATPSQDEIGGLEEAVRRADRILADRKASLALALEASRLGLFEIDLDNGKIISPSHERMEAFGLPDGRLPQTIDELIESTHPADRLWVAGTWERFLVRGGTLETEFRLLHPDSNLRWVALRAQLVETDGRPRVLGAIFDVTDRKEDEAERQRLFAEVEQHRQELAKLSITDDLTNLLNRRGYHLLAEHELNHADRAGTDVMLLFADLDGLKRINDTHGHAAGSQALIDMADVLRATFRGSDVIARLGGDEFCILLSRSIAGVSDMTVTDRLQRALRERNAQGDRPYQLSASVGACRRRSGSSLTLEQMTKQADELMYQEKHRRRVGRVSEAADDSIIRV
jgi:diguanylate cyclase (GGDEF)-like protein/PAS domain S-box-containing protein